MKTLAAIIWVLDSLSLIGGHPVKVIGAPVVVQTEVGPAIQFNGKTDGLLIENNPLQGLPRFTVEVLFAPDADGGEEQRFLHLSENGSENRRALLELRQQPGGAWSLDTYLRHDEAQLAQLDLTKTHAPGWHVATLTYDGTAMTHYVDGVRELSGAVAFKPLTAGKTSIGVRQNLISYFKGRIRTVRVTPRVLEPKDFLAVPPARVIALWPEGVPGIRADASPEREVDGRITNVHTPTLTYYPPAAGTANGTAVIACAGGSYARLAISNEIDGIRPTLTSRGVAVFVLKYRLAEYGHPAPLRDVLRAIRMVRSRASEFGLKPDRIGVFGASAGGHVAASAATLYDAEEGRTGAPLDRISARPDFVALQYPVITMKPPFAHAMSRTNLIGASPSPALVERLSLEGQVTPQTPPVFIVHTSEDKTVPIENSQMFARALRDKGVSVEAHFYERGAHGFGVSKGLGPTSEWPTRLIEWLDGRGLLGRHESTLIFPGDHPDPTVLKDGDDYYMTHSSFDAYPGLLIWHSRDLINWEPVTAALTKNVGSVWAPELTRHNGRYFIYLPARTATYQSNYVIWADNIRGPWSDPIDLKVGRIDPGHAVGADGKRYLFLSAGMRVPLAPDGLSVTGPQEKVYDGWKYPADWVVESFSQEGPKVLKHGSYYYMVLAEGGTAGPPTGHMIVAARSRSIDGPWEDAPNNPVVRTTSADEHWWSKGHGSLVEGPGGQWYVVYHAYENGFYTLGRQTLIEPIEWTDDGWFRTSAKPMPAPKPVDRGPMLSDDFSTSKMGRQWSFYKGDVPNRARYENHSLVLKALGKTPADSSPLAFVAPDHAYEISVEMDIDPGATAGLLVFYSSRLYAGMGYSSSNFILHRYGTERPLAKPATVARTLHVRLRNDRHIVTIDYSADGTHWESSGTGMEVSGYHHNVAGEFLSLRPAIYAAGDGEVRFKNFTYRTLP